MTPKALIVADLTASHLDLEPYFDVPCQVCGDLYTVSSAWPFVTGCPACTLRTLIELTYQLDAALEAIDDTWQGKKQVFAGRCPLCHAVNGRGVLHLVDPSEAYNPKEKPP